MVLRASKKRSTQKKVGSTKPKSRKRIAVVVARFNEEICHHLLEGALKALEENQFSRDRVRVFRVAGAFEVPFMAKKVALSKQYLGVIAIGCVIRGDTPHFEYISLATTMGCLQASLDSMCPVAFGVITVNNMEQAIERSQMNEFNKGREAAHALLDSLETLETL